MGKNRGKKGKSRKGKKSAKDYDPEENGDDLLAEEITALSAIFQDDFSIVLDHPGIKELLIQIRPHSDQDNDCSVQLYVRCLPAYPWKPPKLHIVTSNKDLKADCHLLQTMLVEQAASCSREGRVMIYNLAEAAQEYLSECLAKLATQKQELILKESDTKVSEPSKDHGAVPMYSFYCDLWGEHDGSWEGPASVPVAHTPFEKQTSLAAPANRAADGRPPALIIPDAPIPEKIKDPKKEEELDECSGSSEKSEKEDHAELPHTTNVTEFLQRVRSGNFKMGRAVKHSILSPDIMEELPSSLSPVQDEAILSIQKDLILAYLLRIVCGKRGPLPNTLPTLASQLLKLGVLPPWAEDLVAHQPQLFDATFKRIFGQIVSRTDVSEFKETLESFWNASPDLFGEGESYYGAASRYLSDFEELCLLGKGGFGHVVLCKNKLDGRRYAMKKVRLRDENPSDKILREVATLSRLQHQHVVRYYQAWFETAPSAAATINAEDCESSAEWTESLSTGDINLPSTFLYIQMEYCPRTLREVFDSSGTLDKDMTWGIFRQIVEGLAHIHGHGIVHRDLTPSNIFFDPRNDIKIGDFGLAKFTGLENPEREFVLVDEANASVEGTGQVGTYFYRAPEVEQAWPHIDEKVDMYSLGVILFELWHPFNTAMERYVILNELKQQGVLPVDWVARFPQQASLVRLLLAPHPQDRPSARDVLRSELLPPRMEDEALKDILRTIQSADNSSVFDQVIAAVFDEERLAMNDSETLNVIKDLDSHSTKWLEAEEQVVELTKEVFTRHGGHNFLSSSMDVAAAPKNQLQRHAVKVMNSSGSMLELRYDTRRPFAEWVVKNQFTSWKRYELSRTYRKGVGHRAPKEYLQGDFDIVGGDRPLAEAEAVKVAVDIISKLPTIETYELRLNHQKILESIWEWCGVTPHQRKDVAQIVGTMTLPCPQSTDRKAKWVFVRRQLLQGLGLPEAVVDRLQTAERRFTGAAEEVLARLRGAFMNSVTSMDAIEELSKLVSYLRIWHVEKLVMVDVFMAPAEYYYDGIIFQIYIPKGNQHSQSMLVAVGGRYDSLLDELSRDHRFPSPGVAGLTIALQKLVYILATEDSKSEQTMGVLVCSRGGGGLLKERMEIADELWAANVKAEFVCTAAPSLTEQYEYAHENGIKWLVVITESGLSQSGSVKVRHLDVKADLEVARDGLAKFLIEMAAGNAKKMLRYGS